MGQTQSVTHREEKFWRLMVALFGVGVYVMVTTLFPAYSKIPPLSPEHGVILALFAMMALGALYASLSPVVWKYWPTALMELAATGLAVCSAWVLVEGIRGMPKELWPAPAFLLYFLGGVLVWGAALFRTLERGVEVTGLCRRTLWEALLPLSMGTGALLILDGEPMAAGAFVAALMAIQMSWAPGWKTSEIQTCCPG